MKKPFITPALLVLSLLLPTMASATPFSRIVAFGDSLTDTGNLFELTGDLFPPDPPYSAGRFSNGPLWIEYLSDDLGLSVDNFAVGGAKTGHDNRFDDLVPFVEFPGLLDQIEDFEERNPSADPNALYAIWAGADNFLPPDLPEDPVTAIVEAIDDLTIAISTLTLLGAQQFLLFNLPDLGLTPRALELGVSDAATDVSIAFNNALDLGLAGLNIENLIQFDIFGLMREAVANPSAFGFTNVEEPCLDLDIDAFSRCDNPEEFLFWDELHGTTKTNNIIADHVLAALADPTTVPEPATLVLLSLGLAGLGWMRWRKADANRY